MEETLYMEKNQVNSFIFVVVSHLLCYLKGQVWILYVYILQPCQNKSLKSKSIVNYTMAKNSVFLLVIITCLSVFNLAIARIHVDNLECTFKTDVRCLKQNDCLDKCLESYADKLFGVMCIADPLLRGRSEPLCVCGYKCHKKFLWLIFVCWFHLSIFNNISILHCLLRMIR